MRFLKLVWKRYTGPTVITLKLLCCIVYFDRNNLNCTKQSFIFFRKKLYKCTKMGKCSGISSACDLINARKLGKYSSALYLRAVFLYLVQGCVQFFVHGSWLLCSTLSSFAVFLYMVLGCCAVLCLRLLSFCTWFMVTIQCFAFVLKLCLITQHTFTPFCDSVVKK